MKLSLVYDSSRYIANIQNLTRDKNTLDLNLNLISTWCWCLQTAVLIEWDLVENLTLILLFDLSILVLGVGLLGTDTEEWSLVCSLSIEVSWLAFTVENWSIATTFWGNCTKPGMVTITFLFVGTLSPQPQDQRMIHKGKSSHGLCWPNLAFVKD